METTQNNITLGDRLANTLCLHLQTFCDQRVNIEKPVTLPQNTTSAAPSVGKVCHSLVQHQEELASAVANCVDSRDELSSQSKLTTAQLSEQNNNSTLNFLTFTATLYIYIYTYIYIYRYIHWSTRLARSLWFFTVRRYTLHSLCDRNSVRLSVTLVGCVHMVRPTIMISSLYGSRIILVSGDIMFIPKFEGGHCERERWMRVG